MGPTGADSQIHSPRYNPSTGRFPYYAFLSNPHPLIPHFDSNFLRLGREGYREIMANSMRNAQYLREALEETGKVNLGRWM